MNERTTLVNGDIDFHRVRVVSDDGEQLGIMTSREALKIAYDEDKDLVLISPDANPPVVKVMDYSKFKFDQKKKIREINRKQRQTKQDLKELQCRPNTGEHDLQRLIKRANEFLDDGHKVKVVVKFKGRENANKSLGNDLLERLVAEINGESEQPQLQGRQMFVLIKPS